jgi:UMF1 family MFS transporter
MRQHVPTATGATLSKLRWPAIHAWALYDFANTAFSMNVISTYFALWVTKEHGASDLTYGLAKSISMALVVFLAPAIGAWSDRVGTRKPFIIVSTLMFVLAALAIGLTGNVWVGLALYGFGNIGYQLSSVFYNAMLPALSPPETMGRVSGYGRALGYTGSLIAVFLGMAFATGAILGKPVGLPAGGSQAVFIPTAFLVLAAALPLLFMREPRGEGGAVPAAHAHGGLKEGLAELRRDPRLKGVGAFLIGSFFFFDTINTIRDFMSIYLVKVVGLSETGGSLQAFLASLVVCSLFGALGWGWFSDRTTPKTALMGILCTLAVGFLGLVFITDKLIVMRVLGPLLGLAFGGVLVATRPLLTQLIPQDRQGLFFGLFVLANDVAAIGGPVTWGVVVKLLEGHGTVAYQAALASQLVFLSIGIAFVASVPDPGKRRGGLAPAELEPAREQGA